jgi:hypothetical protein
MRKLVLGATATVVLLAGACGGSSAKTLGRQGTVAAQPGPGAAVTPDGPVIQNQNNGSPTRSSSASVSASIPPSSKTQAGTALAAGPVPGAGPQQQQTQQAPPLQLEASVLSACVRPGTTQTITIKTLPNSAVGYDSVYPDGKSGLSQDYYGGNNGGQANATGTWTDTWKIAPNAPAGLVSVDVAGANANGSVGKTAISFKLSDVTGKCA